MRLPQFFAKLGLFLLLTLCHPNPALAQLAITEVHSAQSTNGVPSVHADWWELSNLGTSPIDLTGYRFNDDTGGLAAGVITLPSVILSPNESAIFVETLSESDFRKWWGEQLKPDLRVFTYSTNSIGLSSSGDALWLWNASATNTLDIVTSAEFSAASLGASWIPNPTTGLMTDLSSITNPGTFPAADNADLASPGTHPGPVPLRFATEASDQTVNPGDTAKFTVLVHGLPRPRYQWSKDGVPIQGAHGPSLEIKGVAAEQLGSYQVTISNGLETKVGRAAKLALRELPVPPQFTTSLSNLTALVGGTVQFHSVASGSPKPTYAWSFNGVPLPTETEPSLLRTNVSKGDEGIYSVVAKNDVGSVTNSAQLSIRAKPDLRITEVQSTGALNPDFTGYQDWFELTSFEPNPVILTGWKFDDNSARLTASFTFTNTLVIAPNESIVFVEVLSPDQFRSWWGTNNVGTQVQIVTYSGSGFGLSSGGDGVRIWQSEATADTDILASADFGPGDPGVSFNFDPDSKSFGTKSVLGVNGVFQSAASLDIGSPGRIREGSVPIIRPPMLRATLSQAGLSLVVTGTAGTRARVQSKDTITTPTWSEVGLSGTFDAAGNLSFQLPSKPTAPQQFFRIVVE